MLAIDPPLCAPAVVAATRLFAATGRDPSMHPPPLGESTRALAADPRPRTPAVVVATRKFADTGRDLCAPAALAADPQPLGAPTCAHHGSTHTRRALRRSTTMRPRRLNSHTLVCGHTHVPDAAGRVPHARTTTIAMDLPPGGGGGGRPRVLIADPPTHQEPPLRARRRSTATRARRCSNHVLVCRRQDRACACRHWEGPPCSPQIHHPVPRRRSSNMVVCRRQEGPAHVPDTAGRVPRACSPTPGHARCGSAHTGRAPRVLATDPPLRAPNVVVATR